LALDLGELNWKKKGQAPKRTCALGFLVGGFPWRCGGAMWTFHLGKIKTEHFRFWSEEREGKGGKGEDLKQIRRGISWRRGCEGKDLLTKNIPLNQKWGKEHTKTGLLVEGYLGHRGYGYLRTETF